MTIVNKDYTYTKLNCLRFNSALNDLKRVNKLYCVLIIQPLLWDLYTRASQSNSYRPLRVNKSVSVRRE